jgi:hypothetical protein
MILKERQVSTKTNLPYPNILRKRVGMKQRDLCRSPVDVSLIAVEKQIFRCNSRMTGHDVLY